MQNLIPRKKYRILLSITLAVIVVSCSTKAETETEKAHHTLPNEKNSVETSILVEQDFLQEIVSNGKLSAIQKADLYFESSGLIKSIEVKNGQRVNAGAPIAALNSDDFAFALQKAEFRKEQAEIDKLDAFIGMGYAQDAQNITADHQKIANIRSGYHEAELQYREAKLKLDKAVLTAPFSGTIEGLKQHPHEKANPASPFCTLLNDKRFYIDFPLLETEIAKVKLGQKVSISPIASPQQSQGLITEINPRIDENGLVWLKAEVKNPGSYMEGMNVNVSIKQAIPNQLVVPKQAVVLRQNREVLFRYTQGMAYWTYINVLNENEKEYSVVAAEGATLELGDTVIISNNLNLAHESEVEMK